MIRLYKQPHRFYAGGDLHARTLYLHILDDQGKTRFEKNLAANPETFLEAIAPFRDGLVVGVECMFAWYWLIDLCEDEHIRSAQQRRPRRQPANFRNQRRGRRLLKHVVRRGRSG